MFFLSKLNSFNMILISIIIFSIIYTYLGKKHYQISDKDNFNYLHFLYYSTVTQSLLGYGDTTPITSLGKIVVILQVLITVYLTLTITNF